MKRKRVTIKKKVVKTLKAKQLTTVTGGHGGWSGGSVEGQYDSGGSRICGRH